MKNIAFILTLAVALLVGIPAFAADVTTPVTPAVAPIVSVSEVVVVSPYQVLVNELNDLKLKEADPATGAFTRFILGFKIRQVQNQLTLMGAVK